MNLAVVCLDVDGYFRMNFKIILKHTDSKQFKLYPEYSPTLTVINHAAVGFSCSPASTLTSYRAGPIKYLFHRVYKETKKHLQM